MRTSPMVVLVGAILSFCPATPEVAQRGAINSIAHRAPLAASRSSNHATFSCTGETRSSKCPGPHGALSRACSVISPPGATACGSSVRSLSLTTCPVDASNQRYPTATGNGSPHISARGPRLLERRPYVHRHPWRLDAGRAVTSSLVLISCGSRRAIADSRVPATLFSRVPHARRCRATAAGIAAGSQADSRTPA